jgi:hypothetical protein
VAHRRGRVIDTDARRLLVLHVSSDDQEREQSSEDYPNVESQGGKSEQARVAAANAILDCAYGKPVVVEKNHYHQCPHMAFAGLYSPKCHCVEMRAPAAPEKNPWAASAPKRSLVSCILEDSRWRQ